MGQTKLQEKIKEVEMLTENMTKLTLEHEEKMVENNELKEILLRQEHNTCVL